MARPIKSTKVQRFFKYTGLTVIGLAIMGIHFYIQPPERFTKRGYRDIVETNKFIWTDRGISPHAFGGVKDDGIFSPPTETK